jgi:hypothetical protein
MLRVPHLHHHSRRRQLLADLQVPAEAAPAVDGMASLAQLAAPEATR